MSHISHVTYFTKNVIHFTEDVTYFTKNVIHFTTRAWYFTTGMAPSGGTSRRAWYRRAVLHDAHTSTTQKSDEGLA